MIVNELHDRITNKDYKGASEYLKENVARVFDPKYTEAVYNELKDKEFLENALDIGVLIAGWSAFLCKDNDMVTNVLERLQGKSFACVYETSSYASLWAISGYKLKPEERLYYAKKAIQVLPQGDTSFYMGYAKYTCAKIAEEAGEHEVSVPYFRECYEIFDYLKAKGAAADVANE